MFKEIVRTDKQTTVVLLNAIGYIYIQMTKVDYAGKDEFMVRTLKKSTPLVAQWEAKSCIYEYNSIS